MNTIFSLVIILIPVLLLGFGVHRFLVSLKRPYRVGELRHHVDMILDTAGCEKAHQHADDAVHLMEHYRIFLTDVGVSPLYCGESLEKQTLWLSREAEASSLRAKDREMEAEAERTQVLMEEAEASVYKIRFRANA